jgi:hypothetical protein
VKNKDSLIEDIHLVDKILKQGKVVKDIQANQIRLFFNGNPKSHLFLKFAHLHPTLWGKYPKLTNIEIESILHMDSSKPIDPWSNYTSMGYKFKTVILKAKTFHGLSSVEWSCC